MATSGTISATTFTTRQVIEHSARRAGLAAERLTPEHITTANGALYLLLSDLANQGAPLWCIERVILPLYEGNYSVPTGVGTVDVLNANLRYLQEVTGTNTDAAASRTIQFADDTEVTTVGIKWSATSVPLSFERSDDGSTWTVIQTETPDAASGEWTWYDMAPVVASLYFRVRATTGSLSFSTIYTGNSPTEIQLGVINKDDWTNLPNKSFQSNQPLQYWMDRQVPQPIMRIWPMPNEAAEERQIVIWRHRYIMDVGTMVQTLDVPQRWFEAVVAMLAAKLVIEFPDADIGRSAMLDQKAERALYIAQQEESDHSPINIVPAIGVYTA